MNYCIFKDIDSRELGLFMERCPEKISPKRRDETFTVPGRHNDRQDLENRSHTGFSRLDEILKGMSAGNLIILATRPKVGKTAFALSIAENVAKSGKTLAFYSPEMESSEIYERLLSKRSKIPMNTLIERGARAQCGQLKLKRQLFSKLTKFASMFKGTVKIAIRRRMNRIF